MIIQGLVHVSDDVPIGLPHELSVASVYAINELLDVGPSAVRALAVAHAALDEPTPADSWPLSLLYV